MGSLGTTLDILDVLVLSWGKSAESSSFNVVGRINFTEDKLSHGSVAHHGVDHALELRGEIFSLG